MKNFSVSMLFLISSSIFSQNMQINDFDGKPASLEEVLQAYVRIPSVSGQEKKAGDYFKMICRNNNLHIADFGSENGRYNFSASIFPLSSGKPNIILLNHIDVVPESTEINFKPFSGHIDNGEIFGRGALDNKGAAMVQLYGMLKLINNEDFRHSNYNISLLSVSCEETQCAGGISYVLENFNEQLNPVVVFGEGPSELTSLMEGNFNQPIFGISITHKRPLWLELSLESKTNGHGSISPKTYANQQLVVALNHLLAKKLKAVYTDINMQFLKDMGVHEKGIKKIVLKNPKLFKSVLTPQLRKHPELFSLFSNSITLTNIFTNSDAINKLSSIAGAQLDCRLLPDTDEKLFLKMIRERLKNDSIKITIIKSVPKIEPSNSQTVFYKNLHKAIQEKYPQSTTVSMMMPNTNDLGPFRANKIPAYGTLPFYCSKEEVRSVHGKNEHIQIKSLYEGADVFYFFLRRMIREGNEVKEGLRTKD